MTDKSFKGTFLAAAAVVGVGLVAWRFSSLRTARKGEGRCPFSGAFSKGSGGGGCPHAHPSSTAHSPAPANEGGAGKKARFGAILPFQPRPFTPEQLARCTGADEDPLGLLLAASQCDTLTDSTSRRAQLEDDLSATAHMVCISVRGVVYKVTPQFYGEGEPYSVYAGKDITRCLALGRVSDEEANLPWSTASAEAFAAYYTSSTSTSSGRRPIINAEKAAKAIAEVGSADGCYDGEFTADELATLDLWVQKYNKKYEVVGWFAPFAQLSNSDALSSTTLYNGVAKDVCKTPKEVLAYVTSRVNVEASPSALAGTVPSTRRRLASASTGAGSEVLPDSVLAEAK